MLRSVRNDATQRTIWSAPLYRKNFMALYYDLPVFKDVYQMTLRIFQVTTNFTGDA